MGDRSLKLCHPRAGVSLSNTDLPRLTRVKAGIKDLYMKILNQVQDDYYYNLL